LESSQLRGLNPLDFGCKVLEFGIVREEVPCFLYESTELGLHLCNSVGVAKGILENSDEGWEVSEVDSAITDMGLDLVSSIALQVVHS